MPEIVLLPAPRKLIFRQGVCSASDRAPVVQVDHSLTHPQGYCLNITEQQVTISSREPAGAFYARQTLDQIRSQCGEQLPCLEVEDWPDFAVRGVMLDISRNKVPTMATLCSLVDLLATWKINQLQLYTEHTFAYSAHCTVWENASPMTGDEIREFDRYCQARYIDLVPNQNSFGHMERWLKHPQYQHLAEAIDGADTPWGFRWKGPFSLCPADPQTLNFLGDLYTELLPNFSSKFFNVGCDETFDIGQGRSKAESDRLGVHRVYLNFIRDVSKLVHSRGRQMMFWGDVILHQPDLIAELPSNVIALQWGYEANHPFDVEGAAFAKAGIPYYVCPGTSTWNSIGGRTQNAIENLTAAAESGMKHGAIGCLITDWGDNGHLQYQPASYLGFAAGAAFSWCLEANRHLSNVDVALQTALNRNAFQDISNTLGKAAYDLGNVYRVCGKSNVNGSALFRLLVPHPGDAEPEKGMTEDGFQAAEAALVEIRKSLQLMSNGNEALELARDEFLNSIAMLFRCCAIGREKCGFKQSVSADPKSISAEHRRLWLVRNRPGGLEDSLQKLTSFEHSKGQHF